MTEREQVREQMAAIISLTRDSDSGFIADEILRIGRLEVKADDQSLPKVRKAVNESYNDYMLGQEDMLKAGFVKVIK